MSPLESTKYVTINTGPKPSTLPVGSIPTIFKEVKIEGSHPQFSADVLETTETVMVPGLNTNMQFPPHVRVFVEDYSGEAPLPNVTGVFIKKENSGKIKPGCAHYIYGVYLNKQNFDTEFYAVVDDIEPIRVFGKDMNFIKRVPKIVPQDIQPHRESGNNFSMVINIGSDTLLPEHIGSAKELWLKSRCKFEASTISGLDTLVIDNLVEGMYFPETLERLFIRFDAQKRIHPKVRNIYIHANHVLSKFVPDDDHYIFFIRQHPVPRKDDDIFVCLGERETITVCGEEYSVLKRVRRVPKPVIVPQTCISLGPRSAIMTEPTESIKPTKSTESIESVEPAKSTVSVVSLDPNIQAKCFEKILEAMTIQQELMKSMIEHMKRKETK